VAVGATEIHDAMVAVADQQRAVSERAYLKDSYSVHLGVSIGATRRIVKDWRQKTRPAPDVALAVARELWDAGVFDDRRAATELWVAEAGLLPPEHLDELAAMVRDARTWALVDPLAHAAAGTILTHHPTPWRSPTVGGRPVVLGAAPLGALPVPTGAGRRPAVLGVRVPRRPTARRAGVLRAQGHRLGAARDRPGHADDVEGFCRLGSPG